MRSNSPRNSESGFTLLEVLIAICILSFISVGIYQAVSETFKIRESISTEGDFYNGIRLSMNILQRDLTLLYSPISQLPKPKPVGSPPPGVPAQPVSQLQPSISAEALQLDPNLGQLTDFWEPAMNASGIRLSRFVGTDNKITFISNSHLRVYKDSSESEFARITYEFIQDDQDKEFKMLVKTENTDTFNLETRSSDPFSRTYPLLHGVRTFKFRFYRKDKDEWGPSWDTDKDEFRYMYPDIVELTLEVQGPPRTSFEGRFLFRPELPLRALNPSM